MRFLLFLFFLIICCQPNSFCQVLIKNVNVLDVENKKMLVGYNVVALDGKIVSIDKGRTYKLPDGTEVIDATGKYLIPGLVDAHVHFFQSGGIYARPDVIDLRKIRPHSTELQWVHDHMEEFLKLYSAAGITSVIDVGASVNFLKQRDSFATKTYAPRIAMTGPLLTTYIPDAVANLGDESPFIMMKTTDSVRQTVRDQQRWGSDFLKIWYIVLNRDKEKGARENLPLVQAAIDEAHKLGMKVAVHATEQITARLAVESGADFLVHSVEDEVLSPGFVELLRKKKTVLCPTLQVGGNYIRALGHDYHFEKGELSHTHPYTAATILDYPAPDTTLGNAMIRLISGRDMKKTQASSDSIMEVNLRLLVQGGVTIATGTDAGNIGTQHAGSYFRELQEMKLAGMDEWQLLQASTINGAKAIGWQDRWGSLSKGKEANMVLLKANPLDSIANWKKIDKVFTRGVSFRPDSFLVKTPEMLAQEQLNAYNAHDLEAFLAPYAEDVEIFSFPGKSDLKGKEAMRQSYGFLNTSPTLYCRLLNRIVQGNMVIDHEEILGVPGAPHYGVAIYIIKDGKISQVYFPN